MILKLLNQIFNAFTICCAQIQADLTLTLSILNSSAKCISTPITQALINANGGTLSITSPGNYVFSENIVSTANVIISISSNDITIDLCGRTLSGATIGSFGIQVNPGTFSNIRIKNGNMIDMKVGVHVLSGSSNVIVTEITTTNCSLAGFGFNGFLGGTAPIKNCLIKNCQSTFSATAPGISFSGLYLANCDTVIVEDGLYNQNGSDVVVSVAGILLNQCSNCRVFGASCNENFGPITQGIHILTGTNNTVESCSANENISTGTVNGFLAENGIRNQFINCGANNNNAPIANGFGLGADETNSSVISCLAEGNIGLLAGRGIWVDGVNNANFNLLKNNTLTSNSHSGILDSNILFTGLGTLILGGSTSILSGNTAITNGALSGLPALSPLRNYAVAYGGITPYTATLVSVSLSSGTAPGGFTPTQATLLSNLDMQN